jgi:hypothetical protein
MPTLENQRLPCSFNNILLFLKLMLLSLTNNPAVGMVYRAQMPIFEHLCALFPAEHVLKSVFI